MICLEDKQNFIKKLFSKTFKFQGFIYLDSENNPTKEITSKIINLENIFVISLTMKRAIEIAFEFYKYKHPKYKDIINLN